MSYGGIPTVFNNICCVYNLAAEMRTNTTNHIHFRVARNRIEYVGVGTLRTKKDTSSEFFFDSHN